MGGCRKGSSCCPPTDKRSVKSLVQNTLARARTDFLAKKTQLVNYCKTLLSGTPPFRLGLDFGRTDLSRIHILEPLGLFRRIFPPDPFCSLKSVDRKRGQRKGSKTSKSVKIFSTLFDIFRAGQKTSKIVKKCQNIFDTFRQFSRGTSFPAGGSDKSSPELRPKTWQDKFLGLPFLVPMAGISAKTDPLSECPIDRIIP